MKTAKCILIILFVISRVLFINTQPLFFDSQEYLTLFAHPSYKTALMSGHLPSHIGHIFIYWPLYHLALQFHFSPVIIVILSQIIISTLAVIAFYYLCSWLVNQKTALVASIFISLIPMWWITSVTLMMESTYIAAFILSWYFLTRLLEKQRWQDGVGMVGMGVLGLITQPVTALWLPVYAAIAAYKKKERLGQTLLLTGLMGSIGFSLITGSIMMQRQSSFEAAVYILLGEKRGELGNNRLTIPDVVRMGRNAFIPLIRTQTLGLVITGFLGLLWLMLKRRPVGGVLEWWIIPFIITNQFWDGLFGGRHALLSGFGLALAGAVWLNHKPKLTYALIFYLLITTLPAMYWLKRPIPYLELQKAVKTLPESGLLIVSHFARPQIQHSYQGEVVFVNEPGRGDEIPLTERIQQYLSQHKPVWVSSDALFDPYGLYVGPYFHPLSLSYAHDFSLQDDLKDFTVEPAFTIEESSQEMMYKITPGKGDYPAIPHLTNHPRRLDYTDPFTLIWLEFRRLGLKA